MDNLETRVNSNIQDEITLKDLFLKIKSLFRYILSKWYILLVAGILGGVIGFFYAKSKTTLYTATTTFVLEGGDAAGGGLGQYAGVAAMMGLDLGGGSGGMFQGDNLVELYKSRKMLETVLNKRSPIDSSKLILDYYFDMNDTKKVWKEKTPELLTVKFGEGELANREKDSVLLKVVEDINKNILTIGKLDKKSSIFKVDVKSKDEVFSKIFNEELVKEVNSFYIDTRTRKSLDNIAILQQKADSVRAVMNGAISSAAVAIDNTPNLNPTKQAQRLVPTQKSQFSAETNKAILGQLVQNLEMSKMSLMKEAPLIQVVDEPVYPLAVDRFGKLKGIILGAFLFGFIFLLSLIARKFFKEIMA